jgi:membrane protease YdiL (CAAX protease family)
MQGNSFKEKCMPAPKSILSKDLILPVFALGLCAQFVGYAINSTIVGAFTEYTGFGDEYVFFSGMKHGYQIVIYIISIAVIPAISEELIFRKTFCDALAPYGPKTAIFVTSILFSLMHTSFERIFHTFICGLFCSWLYIGTKNIKLPMLLHFLNNFFAAIEVVLWYRVSEDAYSTARVARLVISLVVSIVCFIYLRAKRREQLDAEHREAKSSDTYDEYLEKKKKYAHYTEMLPDENGEEVVSLSTRQKISGFFSPAMIAFIVAIFIQMCYYLSFELV